MREQFFAGDRQLRRQDVARQRLGDIQRFVIGAAARDIGEMVMDHLSIVDEVAYVRFASVYRQFQGIRDFVDTLHHLNQGRNQK